ncbi:MAG: division/cell wall cluster transcriptional repressor MraZ [Puniceicoccaceae bacterium]
MTNSGQPVTYVSEYVHNLDARNRVTVPSNWRVEGDEGNYYLAWQHPNGFIAVYPPDIQEELREKMRSTQLTDVEKQKALKAFYRRSHIFGCDKQGRILLTDKLRAHAGIDKQVGLVGVGRYFEIWDGRKVAIEEAEDPNLLDVLKQIGF